MATAKQTLSKLPQFVLLKEVGLVKYYRATVPISHRLECDALAFLVEAMTQSTTVLIEKELNQLRGLKFTLVLVAVLEKSVYSLEQVYDENAEPNMIITTGYFRSFNHFQSLVTTIHVMLGSVLEQNWDSVRNEFGSVRFAKTRFGSDSYLLLM